MIIYDDVLYNEGQDVNVRFVQVDSKDCCLEYFKTVYVLTNSYAYYLDCKRKNIDVCLWSKCAGGFIYILYDRVERTDMILFRETIKKTN